ncbi:hypothetical protein ABZ725_06245 [Streptomyces sp. NPDC006872]|uniref:hypothetical protein n=1 Tax=Streptomyces sp. NPDC006872 TaxID=3155720 RepID=UPI003401386A
MSDTSEAAADVGTVRSKGGRARRAVFRLVMVVLILLLAGRTYEETAVALARSNGSLDTAAATVTEVTSRTVSGYSGGGQDGGNGTFLSHTEFTVRLALGEGNKTVDQVEERAARDLWEGRRVQVGLWHGRVVEIEGRNVWRGWHFGALDVTLMVLMPLITGYLVSLAVLAAAFLTARAGRVRLGRDDRFGPCALGWAVGMFVLLALLMRTAFGDVPPYWPAFPVGAGATVALVLLSAVIRRHARTPTEDAPVGADDTLAQA